MPITKQAKKQILDNLKDKVSQSKSIVFAKYDKLKVVDSEVLRKQLKAEGSEYVVAKKTLLDIALKENKIEGVDPKSFEGKVAAIFGYQDEVSPAKIISNFQKDHKVTGDKDKNVVEFVGGILEGKFLNAAEVTALSKLPSKLELYAKLVGSMNAPISGFVNVMAGNIRALLYALKAIEAKK